MWKKITIEEKNFVIRTSVNKDEYEIMLSDFSKVWIESLSEEQLLNRCKEMNPLCEAESNILIKKILELTDPEQGDIRKELLEVGNQLTVTFSSHLKGFIFKFSFILILATSEKFCQSLTIPLIQVIEELQARQKMLCDLLIRKDEEINEYKMEGAQVSRKNVITQPFNEETFFENSYNKGEERSLKNLQCPFTFFEKSCAKMYEECIKREKVVKTMLTPKKDHGQDKPKDTENNRKPELSKRKKGNDVIFDDEEVDDDETHFSIGNVEVKPTIKVEVKDTAVKKKRKRLNL